MKKQKWRRDEKNIHFEKDKKILGVKKSHTESFVANANHFWKEQVLRTESWAVAKEGKV